MNKIKSISKRTIALVLSMLMLLSSGIVGTLAANVELAPVGANTVAGGYVYFDNTKTQWTDSCIQFVIGHGSFSRTYTMSKIANTNLYYVNLSSSTYHDWSDATYYAVIGTSSKWGDGNWGSSNLTNATHRTAAYTTGYNMDGDTKRHLVTPSTSSNGTSISINYKGTTYSSLNSNQTVYVRSAESGGSTYSNDASAGTVKVEGYYLSANSTAASRSAATTLGSTYTTYASLAAGTTVKLTATVNEGYTFKGWYNSSGTQVGTALTYSYAHSGSAATYYARYEKVETKVTATFNDWNGTKLYEVEVDKGTTPTYGGATPTREGYTFTGWVDADGNAYGSAITEDTTYTAQYTANTYTITYYDEDRTTVLGTAEAYYDTLISAATAPSATKASTEQYEYAFGGWTLANGTAIGNTKVTDNVSVYATYTETIRSYTVNYSGENGTVSVAYADGTVVPDGSAVPYGTVLTLTATPNKFYSVGTWTASTGSVIGNTYTVTGDVTLTHTFAAKTTHTVRLNQGGALGVITATPDANHDFEDLGLEGNGTTHSYKVENGASIDFIIDAPIGYYISKANNVSYTNDYSNTRVEFSVNNVTATPTNVNVLYSALPTYNVTVSANDSTMGTVTGANDAVIYGNMVNLTATANEGYRFVNWVVSGTYSNVGFADTLAVTSLVPQSDLTITANFAANEGTVNVFATEGGTVDKNGTHNLTYPETITATATATETGYQFTHWTINSTGTKDTDYAVTEQGNEITVQILTDGTEVSVIANFADSRKIKVYTYSDAGFKNLTVNESKGTTTQEVYDGTQTLVQFGEQNWYTPGELTLTAGFTDSITAQLSSGTSDSTTGTVIYVQFSDTWLSSDFARKNTPYLTVTTSSNNAYKNKLSSTDTSGVEYSSSNNGCSNYCAANDIIVGFGTKLGDGLYKWEIPSSALSNLQTYGFTVYSKEWHYNDMYRINVAHGTYQTGKDKYIVSDNNSYNTNRQCYGYDISVSATNQPTQTSAIDIVSALYDGNQWLDKEEVWIYFDSTGNNFRATDRRELNNTVNNTLIKNAYNNGVNGVGYEANSWSAFTAAYTTAISVLGAGASTQDDINEAYENLVAKYEALDFDPNVTITGSNGAVHGSNSYFGTFNFGDDVTYTTKTDGKIGDNNGTCPYYVATVVRGTTIEINTTVTDSDYIVLGWVVNGTGFIDATQDTDNTNLFIGYLPCTTNAVVVPVYFRADTIAKTKSTVEEEREQVIKVYAKLDENSTTWGNYLASYTWTGNQTGYRQFGEWTGQLMIPDRLNPGMYYTYVEVANPDNAAEVITGITFNNYGNNKGVNSEARYQAYDYYEFIELTNQGFDNVVFELNESDGVENWPKDEDIDINTNDYNFYPFVDFSGNQIDITRTLLTDEQKALDPALYIVRTGPCDPDTDGIGPGWANLSGSDFYVNAYLYNANGECLGVCKTYELTNLEELKTERGIDLTTDEFVGKPVVIDYASLTTKDGNSRYDGEWYGTKYGFTNVTISAEVAYLNNDGTVTYYYGQNEVEDVGNAYFNGEHTQEVPHGSENHVISARVADGNDFVGWYLAKKSADGTTYTIDTTAAPLIVELSNSEIDASSDMIYVAVFKEHPEGTFTVNNFYYTYTDFNDQTISPYAPPVFGNDITYSTRDVKIRKIYDKYTNSNVDITDDFAGNYTQSMGEISVGDVLEITIKTKPTFSRDYVYAWYIQANDSYGVNFEEIGTNVIEDNYEPGVEKEFTFTYTVKEGTSSLTIYSDVVHITPEVTLTYIYNNRYNQEQRYVVKYTLTTSDELSNYKPDIDKIREYAPYVDDLYKKVNWVIEDYDNDISVAGTSYNVRAVEEGTFTVNLIANGSPAGPITVPFNTPIDIYAKDINKYCTDRGGVWFLDKEGDGSYDEGTDKLLNYGNYFGLVVTDDMTVVYTDNQELIYQIILGDPIYGREQSTDANGGNAIDTIYVDYILSYMIPHFTGDKIDVNGTDDTSDDVTLKDDVNYNTPVQIKTLEEAGLEVDYGVVLEMVNTQGPADTRNDYYDTYYDVDAISDATKAKLDAILTNKADGADASGKGVEDGSTLATFLYVYASENATNKNRVLKTFAFDNTPANQMKYYNVYGYLKITDKNDNVKIIYSNPQTLNILDESIENVAQN
ncbi:MAG: InlB B-repeat-containing protein [Clostridia bacterium]|nr:InlB B-repeat-containing protein [Clostridia bacterium]